MANLRLPGPTPVPDDVFQAMTKQMIDHRGVEFAELVSRLAAIPEGEGSLLDTAAIYYGSGLGSGNAHTPFDLPVLLAGRAGGAIRPAGHVKLPMDTSLYNLWVTLLGACDVTVRQFGNSSGPIDAIRA